MKKSFSNFALLAIAGAAAFSSCSKEMDYYNPNAAAEEYAQKWENVFGTIDSQQDWNMATQVSATISINEDALSDYNLQLFTANPLYEDAYILADFEVTTDASGNASKTFNVDIPKGTTQLYAVRMDSHKRRLVKLANVTSSGINVSFGTTSSAKAAPATRVGAVDDMEDTKVTCPYGKSAIETLLASAVELGSQSYENKVCKVSSDLTYTNVINSHANISTVIIPQGVTLTLSGSNTGKIENVTIIVAGTLDISACTGGVTTSALSLDSNSSVYVMEGGKVVCDNTSSATYSLNINGGTFYNAGTVNVGNINMNSWDGGPTGTLYNAGVLTADIVTMVNTGTELTNWGKMQCTSIYNKPNTSGTYESGLGTVNNGCYLKLTGDFSAGCLNEGANSTLEANVMQVNATWTLRENTILRAEKAVIAGNTATAYLSYKGDSEGNALVSFKEFTYINNGKIDDRILLETNTALTEGESEAHPTYTGNNVHNFVTHGYSNVGEADITIEGSEEGTALEDMECVGEGNTPTPNGGGGNDTPNYWIIACEDLGNTGDRDFNDIVVKVSYVRGKETATVTPIAAGGVYKAVVKHDGGLEREIHEWLGQTGSDGSYPITNTIKGGTAGSGDPVTINVDKETFSMSRHDITITVSDGDKGTTQTIKSPDYGTAPAMLVLPNGWKYPLEYTQIEDAYTGFGSWVTDADVSTWTGSGVDSLLY